MLTTFFIGVSVAGAEDKAAPINPQIATYPELPYYIRQLTQTDSETKRMQLNKIIHEGVVNADLSSKKVVKEMEPIIDKIRVAMDSGLDRAYLEGQSMWLGSAVDYFEREKLREVVDISESDWMDSQLSSHNGMRISVDPGKILLLQNGKTKTIAESSNIYEGIISQDGRRVAFFRRTDDTAKAEVWVVNLKNLKREKIATLPSCITILFSLDGGRLYMQEKPADQSSESTVWSVSPGGGKPHKIGQARLLQTVVAKGKYEGNLIVFKRIIHHMGTTQKDCAYAWDLSGKEIGRLKNGPCN